MSRSSRPAMLSASTSTGTDARFSDEHGRLLAAIYEAKEGYSEGTRCFLEAIAPWVRKTCVGVLGAGHPDLDDTLQDCLLASVKALRNYRFDGDVRHYVTKIALRIAINARRTSAARWRRQDSLRSEAPWADGDAVSAAPAAWSTSEVDLVRRILDHLSSVQSEAVLMRIVLGFSIEEIANMTGVSQNTVKTRIRLGKNALRKDLRKTSFWRRWISERSA